MELGQMWPSGYRGNECVSFSSNQDVRVWLVRLWERLFVSPRTHMHAHTVEPLAWNWVAQYQHLFDYRNVWPMDAAKIADLQAHNVAQASSPVPPPAKQKVLCRRVAVVDCCSLCIRFLSDDVGRPAHVTSGSFFTCCQHALLLCALLFEQIGDCNWD